MGAPRKAELEALLSAVPMWRRRRILKRAARIADLLLAEIEADGSPNVRGKAESFKAVLGGLEMAENIVGKAIVNETAALKLAEALTSDASKKDGGPMLVVELEKAPTGGGEPSC
jgi:hypothetical protein